MIRSRPSRRARRSLLDGGDAAIDRQQQVRLAVAPGADGVGVQPVAFLDAMGHVIGHFGAQHFQAQPEDRRAGHAVDVIIAVDDDPLAGGQGVVDSPHGLGAARQELRIAQRGKLGVEEVPGAVRIGDAAADQQLGYDGRDSGRSLERGDAVRIVGMNTPALGHDRGPTLLLLFAVLGVLAAARTVLLQGQLLAA